MDGMDGRMGMGDGCGRVVVMMGGGGWRVTAGGMSGWMGGRNGCQVVVVRIEGQATGDMMVNGGTQMLVMGVRVVNGGGGDG